MTLHYTNLLVKSFSVNHSGNCGSGKESGNNVGCLGADPSEREDRKTGPDGDAPWTTDKVGQFGVLRELLIDQVTEVFCNLVFHDKLRETIGRNDVRQDAHSVTHRQEPARS